MIEPKWSFWDIFCAVVARLIFALHCIIAAWKVVMDYQNHVYWLVLLGLIGLVADGIYVIIIKKGNVHFKWLRPCIIFYLSSIIPSIWLLELKMYDIRVAIKNDFDAGRNDVLQLEKTTIVNRLVHYNMTFFTGTTLPFESAPRLWVNSLEQCLMFILILARWLLPKGDVVKDYIPLLLMVFLGMAADIIQFFDVFKEPPLRYHEGIVYLILVLITVSLIPFILVPTVASRSTPMEPKYGQTGQKPAEGETTTSKGCGPKACQSAEVLGILATLFLQDMPFLIFRCILLGHYSVVSYMTFFFCVKNGLTIGILLYRLGIVYIEGNKKKDYSEIDDPGDMGY